MLCEAEGETRKKKGVNQKSALPWSRGGITVGRMEAILSFNRAWWFRKQQAVECAERLRNPLEGKDNSS